MGGWCGEGDERGHPLSTVHSPQSYLHRGHTTVPVPVPVPVPATATVRINPTAALEAVPATVLVLAPAPTLQVLVAAGVSFLGVVLREGVWV